MLEATARVGGRMHTISTPVGAIDPGATTIDMMYARVIDAAKRVKVPLVPPKLRGTTGIYVRDTLIASRDWEKSPANRTEGSERAIQPGALEAELLTKNNPLKDLFEWQTAAAARYDIPLTAWLEGKGASREAIRLIEFTINATDQRRASALMYLRDVLRVTRVAPDAPRDRPLYEARADGSSKYIGGGTLALPQAMAAYLGDAVRLQQPVAAVNQSDSGVEVVTLEGRRYRAGHVVCAAPLAVLRNISWNPAPQGALERLMYQSTNTSTTHIYFAVEKPYWDADIGEPGLFTDTALERVFAQRDVNSGEVTWLDCWINGSAAARVDVLDDAELRQFATRELERIRPAMRGKVRPIATHSWGRHPYIRGNKHEYAPGQMADLNAVLATPPALGRVFFAGEHFRVAEPGMEGAAESGQIAAVAIASA